MGEARQASIVSANIEFDKPVSTNIGALKSIFISSIYQWTKANHRIKNNFYNGLYPSNAGNSLYVIGAVFSTSVFGIDPSFGIIEKIKIMIQNQLQIETPRAHIMASFAYSMGLWVVLSYTRRYIFKMLLSYTGWLYEAHGHVGLTTKIWMALVHIVRGYNTHSLYSFQKSLPRLPIPPLKNTIDKYLTSIKHLKTDKEFEEIKALAKDFRRKYGCRVQFFLYIKYLFVNNYVTDWWEDFVYLANRSPLIINSNYYGIDTIYINYKWKQSARAANLICASVACMNLIRKEEFPPIVLQGTVPLCSRQYERLFCTTRIPRLVQEGSKYGDEIVHLDYSKHIVVIHKGRFFKCIFRNHGKYLKPVDLEVMIQSILDDDSEPGDEKFIPVLTAGNRNTWAYARNNYFNTGVNKTSLQCIESAAFVVVLEETSQIFDSSDETKLDNYAQSLIHGTGYNIWFDKSFNLIVFKNGRVGFNAEHSWADAPIMGHFWEYILTEDNLSPAYGYTPSGHCRGIPNNNIPKVERLKWFMTTKLHDTIDSTLVLVEDLIKDLDIHILVYNHYGKGFIKRCKTSPDSFIQMALQMTYYRLAGEFCQTYESSMTRLFLEGRTETVRSCTSQSCNFVKAINDKSVSKIRKLVLFKDAAENHQSLYRDAMTGKGVDRHIFCLYVICKFLRIDNEFLRRALSVPWKLSTSQTPTSQMENTDLTRYPDFISAGGGFGPVADDGYGVSYIIAGEDRLFFHISSKISCKNTNSMEFSKQLCKSLEKIKKMFESDV